MKYLKRMNESSNEDMKGFIEECFIDFLDNSLYDFYIKDEKEYLEIYIRVLDGFFFNKNYNLDDFISMTEKTNEFYTNVKISCEMVINRYPDYSLSIMELINKRDNSKCLTIELIK